MIRSSHHRVGNVTVTVEATGRVVLFAGGWTVALTPEQARDLIGALKAARAVDDPKAEL